MVFIEGRGQYDRGICGELVKMEMSKMDSRQLEGGVRGTEAPTADIAETGARIYQGREVAGGTFYQICTTDDVSTHGSVRLSYSRRQ